MSQRNMLEGITRCTVFDLAEPAAAAGDQDHVETRGPLSFSYARSSSREAMSHAMTRR